jgi:pimeloyl-ACP methyl ester carboxylesterase
VVLAEHGDCDSLVGMAQRLLESAPDRFALAGHSMGGRVALEVCRLAPERVSHLALLDTGHAPLAVGEAGQQEALKRHALLALARERGVHPDRLADTGLIEQILDMFERKSADDFERQIRALLGRPDGAPVLQSLAMPTLVLTGRQDSWANVAQHEAMHRLTGPKAAAALEVIEDSGHMVPMERPAELTQALLRWLAR